MRFIDNNSKLKEIKEEIIELYLKNYSEEEREKCFKFIGKEKLNVNLYIREHDIVDDIINIIGDDTKVRIETHSDHYGDWLEEWYYETNIENKIAEIKEMKKMMNYSMHYEKRICLSDKIIKIVKILNSLKNYRYNNLDLTEDVGFVLKEDHILAFSASSKETFCFSLNILDYPDDNLENHIINLYNKANKELRSLKNDVEQEVIDINNKLKADNINLLELVEEYQLSYIVTTNNDFVTYDWEYEEEIYHCYKEFIINNKKEMNEELRLKLRWNYNFDIGKPCDIPNESYWHTLGKLSNQELINLLKNIK